MADMGTAIPAAVIEVLRDAKNVLVLTGAGVSAESGIPTFREAQKGLWAEFNPQELATPEAFLHDPALVWRLYRWRRKLVAEAKPNPGHFALATLENQVPEMTLITQNVDGLHQRGGSRNVTEFHGNLFTTRCFAEDTLEEDDPNSADPRCNRCGGHLRPGVVWFGEAIPKAALKVATEAADECDVFLSIGTSSLVWPAAGLVESAAQRGATIIEINIHPTPLSSHYDFALQGASGEILPELVRRLAV